MITCASIAGAILGPVVHTHLFPNAHPTLPSGGIGVVVGFVVGIAGMALHRRLSGCRSVGTYPPVVQLRREGWSYPTD
jgi:hypothetical protein